MWRTLQIVRRLLWTVWLLVLGIMLTARAVPEFANFVVVYGGGVLITWGIVVLPLMALAIGFLERRARKRLSMSALVERS